MAFPIQSIATLLRYEIKPSNQTVSVRFAVLGKWYRGDINFAINSVEALLATCEKATLVFQKVVISRSFLQVKESKLSLVLSMWDHDGPFTSDQFLAMLQFDPESTSDDWVNHLNAQIKGS